MGGIDPDGAFGNNVRVERHLRMWGHLPDEECGDTGEDCSKCQRPDAKQVGDDPMPRLNRPIATTTHPKEPTTPAAKNQMDEWQRQMRQTLYNKSVNKQLRERRLKRLKAGKKR